MQEEGGATVLIIGIASGIAALVPFVMGEFWTGAFFLLVTWACIFYRDAHSLKSKKKQLPLAYLVASGKLRGAQALRNLFLVHLMIGLG